MSDDDDEVWLTEIFDAIADALSDGGAPLWLCLVLFAGVLFFWGLRLVGAIAP